jgi:uncharacterized protein
VGRPVVHFEIGGRDKERSAGFYTSVFDWAATPYGPFANKLDTGSAKGIQGFTTALGHEPHNYVLLYIEVDDIPAHLARIEAAGGKTLVPETPIPGGGHFAWFLDPNGNQMGLVRG